MNNGGSNGKQPGGSTGKGFKPGQSGNPKGRRPGVRGLLVALKDKLSEKSDNGQTYERRLVNVLVEDECLKGRNRVAAIQAVLDRLYGKPAQQVTVSDMTRALEGRSAKELLYYATHGRLPEDSE